jgi:hypothetical protein
LLNEEVDLVVPEIINVDEGGNGSSLVGVDLETEFVPSVKGEVSNVSGLESFNLG